MNYSQVLHWLSTKVNFENLSSYKAGEVFSLEPLEKLLQRLALRDWLQIPSVHITGSVAKGSVALLLEDLSLSQGFKTGLYLSPHLRDVTERIRLDGRDIDRELFSRLSTKLQEQETGRETYFEILTALAFLAFEKEKVQMAIWEVGMGGQRDATNLIPSHICIFTPIIEEHLQALGGSLKALTLEKSGIIKETTRLVISAKQPREVSDIIAEAAQKRGAPLLMEGRDFSLPVEEKIHPFQQQNLALARQAARGLHNLFHLPENLPLEISPAKRNLPGRMNLIKGPVSLLMDTAHTPFSLEGLLSFAHQSFPGARKFVILGLLKDKDGPGMISLIEKEAFWIGFCRAPSDRGMDPHVLASMTSSPLVKKEIFERAEEALKRARSLAGKGDLILITGSHRVVGPLMDFIELKNSP